MTEPRKPKTILVYCCACGEDVYEDDDLCVNCGKPTDKSKLREVELPDIVSETLVTTEEIPLNPRYPIVERHPGHPFDAFCIQLHPNGGVARWHEDTVRLLHARLGQVLGTPAPAQEECPRCGALPPASHGGECCGDVPPGGWEGRDG